MTDLNKIPLDYYWTKKTSKNPDRIPPKFFAYKTLKKIHSKLFHPSKICHKNFNLPPKSPQSLIANTEKVFIPENYPPLPLTILVFMTTAWLARNREKVDFHCVRKREVELSAVQLVRLPKRLSPRLILFLRTKSQLNLHLRPYAPKNMRRWKSIRNYSKQRIG